MKPLDLCTERISEEEFFVEEIKSKVIFRNPDRHQVHKINVDGCVFERGDGKRCDWLIQVGYTDKSYLVELKGSDIPSAYLQLIITQEALKASLKRKRFWIISYSGSPRLDGTIQDLVESTRIRYGVRLIVSESPYTHTL